MAITIDYSTSPFTINVPQADLTLVAGSLFEHDTDVFRLALKTLEAAETGIVYQDTHRHNTAVTVAATTFARTVEILNGSNSIQVDIYQVLYTPDTQYSVRLVGSNNNIFDLQNLILANTVTQIIPSNSAGLITTTTGSGLSAGQDTKLTRIHALLDVIEGTWDHAEVMRLLLAGQVGDVSGAPGGPILIKDPTTGLKTRITATVDANGNRIVTATDVT